MRYILLALMALLCSGCFSVRESASDLQKKYDALLAQQTIARQDVAVAKSKLSTAEQLKLNAEAKVREGESELKEARQIEKAEQLDQAKHWRNLFDITATGLLVVAIAIFIVATIQGWPIKWIAYIMGSLAISMYIMGQFYVYVVEYREWVIAGIVLTAIVVFSWALHSKTSFIAQVKDKIKINPDELKGSARRVAKKFKVTAYNNINKAA